MSNTSLIAPSLEQYLQLTSDREQTVAANMANVDTPGYHTKDVNFKAALQRVSSEGELNIVPVSNVGGLLERPDGNNVSLDRESMLLAQTQLQYQLGAQLVKSNFLQLLSAINGGN